VQNALYQIIKKNKSLLERGGKIRVLLNDCFITIFNETDEETSAQKTITLVDTYDYKINRNLSEIIEM